MYKSYDTLTTSAQAFGNAAPAMITGKGVRTRAGCGFAARSSRFIRIAPATRRMRSDAMVADDAMLAKKTVGSSTAWFVRLADILVSVCLLGFLSPLLLVLVAMIRLDSSGPAIFRQQRLGLGGKPFTILKLRSMNAHAEAGGPVWASVGDPRITRMGRFLRSTRLDELPQLLNVLKGDMALIGPRPEREHFTDQLTAQIPLFRSRLLVKPGITGWAQVNLPYGASVEDARAKLAYDLHYVQHRDVRMALRILSRTALVMLSRGGR